MSEPTLADLDMRIQNRRKLMADLRTELVGLRLAAVPLLAETKVNGADARRWLMKRGASDTEAVQAIRDFVRARRAAQPAPTGG